MKKLTVIIIIILLTIFISSCSKNSIKEPNDNKINIYTSVIPLQYFVERIGGDFVNAQALVGPGKNPATYQPTPKQIMGLSRSQILFVIGVPFEKAYLDKTINTLKNLIVIDSSIGIEKKEIVGHHHEDDDEHTDEEDHETESDELDPHVWLSPVLAKTISKNILDSLINIDPINKDFYLANFNEFIKDLSEVEIELHSILDPLNGKTIFVYHPSFGYFLSDYGIGQEAVETGGKEPTPGQLEDMIKEAQADSVKFIVVQPEFSQKSAEVISKAIGGSVKTLNPLSYDYLNNLIFMAKSISEAY